MRSCTFRRRPRQQKKCGSEQLEVYRDPASQTRQSQPSNTPALPLSLESTLLSKGTWQQVTRIEDLCHTHVSHKRLYHLVACAASVLTPHDYITNVQKRLGNRAWTGFGEFRLCAPSWTHSWNMTRLAASPKLRGDTMHAFTLWGVADPGITSEARGLTASQSRPADISLRLLSRMQRRPGCVCRLLHCSSSPRRRRAGVMQLHEFRHKLTAAGAPAVFNFVSCLFTSLTRFLFCSLYFVPEQLCFSGDSNFLGS